MTGNIYVIDASAKQIKVVSSDGSLVRTVVSSQIDRPRAIAVHPGKGYVCVCVCVGWVGGWGWMGAWVGGYTYVCVYVHTCVCVR